MPGAGESIKTFEQYKEEAVKVHGKVQELLKWGRGNKTVGDEKYDMDYRKQCVSDMRSSADKDELSRSPRLIRDSYEHLKTYAAYAKMFGCGNCEEFSALTFELLREKNVTPIDWMQHRGYLNDALGSLGNHAFVIVGRRKETVAENISTWNPEVLWCDPYEGKIGGIDSIKQRFSGKVMILRVRWDAEGMKSYGVTR